MMTTEYNEKSAPSYASIWEALAAKKYESAEKQALLYYAKDPQSEELTLAILAARTGSEALVKIHEGKTVSKVSDDLPLFIKNTVLLERMLLLSGKDKRAPLFEYVRGLLEHTAFVKNAMSDSFIKENAKAIVSFFRRIAPLTVLHEGKQNATLIKLAELLLSHEAYDEARSIYEFSLARGANEVDCRLGILLCALNIQDEEQIVLSDSFDAQMPEYRALLAALSHYKSKRRQYEALAQKNEKRKNTRGASELKRKNAKQRKRKMASVATCMRWARGIFSLAFVFFLFAGFDGMLARELLDEIPFVAGIGEGGIAREIFSIFTTLAFLINLGPALGMTTNLSVSFLRLANAIFKKKDYLRQPAYSARRRVVLVSVDIRSTMAVSLFGEQFFAHTSLPHGFEAAIGAVMGVGAVAFL